MTRQPLKPSGTGSKRLTRATSLALAAVLGLTLLCLDAEAKRLGGGGSFGRQSSNVSQRQAAVPAREPARQAAPTPQPTPTAPIAQPQRNRWLGPLAGIAAGVGIAALMSHFGFGGAMGGMLGSLLMLVLLGFGLMLIWRLIRGGMAPQDNRLRPVYSAPDAGVAAASVGTAPFTPVSVSAGGGSAAPAATWSIPAGFDVPGFTRTAKVNFIRLQAAWDGRNLADIREFTTPEMYAEIKLQIDEDHGATNRTEVEQLEAELLGVETTAKDYLVSVRFTGSIREAASVPAAPFQEVWNLVKPLDGHSGWVLAGIQQVS